jgi:hypothetical protein
MKIGSLEVAQLEGLIAEMKRRDVKRVFFVWRQLEPRGAIPHVLEAEVAFVRFVAQDSSAELDLVPAINEDGEATISVTETKAL